MINKIDIAKILEIEKTIQQKTDLIRQLENDIKELEIEHKKLNMIVRFDDPIEALNIKDKHKANIVYNILKHSNINTIYDLVNLSVVELLRLPKLGRIKLRYILEAMRANHLIFINQTIDDNMRYIEEEILNASK